MGIKICVSVCAQWLCTQRLTAEREVQKCINAEVLSVCAVCCVLCAVCSTREERGRRRELARPRDRTYCRARIQTLRSRMRAAADPRADCRGVSLLHSFIRAFTHSLLSLTCICCIYVLLYCCIAVLLYCCMTVQLISAPHAATQLLCTICVQSSSPLLLSPPCYLLHSSATGMGPVTFGTDRP